MIAAKHLQMNTFRRAGGRVDVASLLAVCSLIVLSSMTTSGCEQSPIAGLGTTNVPVAPGDTPFVLVKCYNFSSIFSVDFIIQVESTLSDNSVVTDGGELTNVRFDGGDSGIVFQCPVDRITLGSLSDANAAGFRTGFPGAAKLDIDWPGDPLVAGFSYNCGDTVIFMAIDNPSFAGGVEIVTGLVGGADQTGPFTGPDTFENLFQLLVDEDLLLE